MFSRNNRMDYQLFFGTRGAFRPFGLNGLIRVVCFNGVVCMILALKLYPLLVVPQAILPALWVLFAVGQSVCPGVPGMLVRNPKCRRLISVWSPLVAIILLSSSVMLLDHFGDFKVEFTQENDKPVASRWIGHAVLVVVVLLVTVSRMGLPAGITRLVDTAEFWRRHVLNSCMVGAIVLALFALSRVNKQGVPLMVIKEAFVLVVVSFGNFQIPAATVRVVLPLSRLSSISHDYKDNCSTNHPYGARPSPTPAPSNGGICDTTRINLAPSLYIFYGMVLGQGALYAVACVLEIFSTIPQRSLVRRGGFKGQSGVDSVKLYYAYALEKCLERNVLAPKISLCSFAIDSLGSDSTKRQIHGIRTAHILLQMETTRTRLLVKLNASTHMMTRLLGMLHWAGQENDTIRLFAAKVINEIAERLLVVTSPGIIQNVSLLLGCGSNQRRGRNPLLDTDGDQQLQNNLPLDAIDDDMERGDTVSDTGDLLHTQDRSTQPARNNDHNCWCWIARWCRQVSELWTVPQEGPLTEHDLLPALGMSIIERLAAYDQSNCEEISKTTGLISKITRFTRFSTSDNTYTDSEKKVLVQSSLNLFQRLTSISGEIGVTLRRKVSNYPFLLRNLSDILGDITSCHEPRKLAAEVLRNLAVDDNTRQKLGRVKRIITRLMQAFLTPDLSSGTDGDRLLSKVAGQALAMLAMGNANNCKAMLREKEYSFSFIKKLTDMIIHFDSHRCVAASLLRSVCMHARQELKEADLLQLRSISRTVLERMSRAEGAELEIFIGLTSRLYEAIPEQFAQDLEHGEIKENFVKHLVSALKKANREPNVDCPGIRKVIVEQSIQLMEYDHPRNMNCFRDLGMMEELLMVEETITDDENYTIFMGDVGLMEAGGEPGLSSLLARAKQLMADGR